MASGQSPATVRTGEELKAALAPGTPGTTIGLARGGFGDVGKSDLSVPDATICEQASQRSTIRFPPQITGDRAQMGYDGNWVTP